MATTVGSPRPSGGLIVPLYTLQKPPSPIFSNLLKPFVASLSSWKLKTLKLCSFSLYNSGMLLGDGNELDDLLARVIAVVSDLFWLCSSGAEFDPLLFLDLSLKKKHFIFLFWFNLLVSNSKIQFLVVILNLTLLLVYLKMNGVSIKIQPLEIYFWEKERDIKSYR